MERRGVKSQLQRGGVEAGEEEEEEQEEEQEEEEEEERRKKGEEALTALWPVVGGLQGGRQEAREPQME